MLQNSCFLLFDGEEQTNMAVPQEAPIWSRQALFLDKILTEPPNKACRWKYFYVSIVCVQFSSPLKQHITTRSDNNILYSSQQVSKPVVQTYIYIKQWLVFIIQFITTLTIIFKCICKLCSLLFCQFKQIKIIFAQIVINLSENWSLSLYSSTAIFPTVQNNLTPSLEMDKFCALDTFPHSDSGQARLIKALCGLSKHSSGPVTLARGKLTCWPCDR